MTNQKTIRCEMCGKDAVCYVQWGPVKEQKSNLCQSHIDEVWRATNHAANGFWIQEPAKEKMKAVECPPS